MARNAKSNESDRLIRNGFRFIGPVIVANLCAAFGSTDPAVLKTAMKPAQTQSTKATGQTGKPPEAQKPAQTPEKAVAESVKQERDRLAQLAVKLWAERKPQESIAVLKQKLAFERENLGNQNDEIINSLRILAAYYEAHGDLESACRACSDALEIARKLNENGKDHWRVINAIVELDDMEFLAKLAPDERQELRDAEQSFRKVREASEADANQIRESIEILGRVHMVRKRHLGPSHWKTGEVLRELAGLYFAQANYDAAQPCFQDALRIAEKTFGPTHPVTAMNLNGLANLYLTQNHLGAAEPLYVRALKIRQAAFGQSHPETAQSLNNLAMIYQGQGRFAAAEPLLFSSKLIRQRVHGINHFETARSINNLAYLYFLQGDYVKAEFHFTMALQIREKVRGPDHPETAFTLNNLAKTYQEQRNYGAAEPLFQRALKIRRAVRGPEHPDTITSINNLAVLYLAQGNNAAAAPLFEEASRGCEKAFGPNHPHTASILTTQALLCYGQGEFTAGELLFQRAQTIFDAILDSRHPDRAVPLEIQSCSEWRRGRSDLARPLVARSFEIQMAHLQRTAAIQNEHQQMLMAQNLSASLNLWMTVTSVADAAADESWPYVLAWKGQITIRQSERRQAVKNDPEFAMLRMLAARVSTLTSNPPGPEIRSQERNAWNMSVALHQSGLESIEKLLSAKHPHFRHDQERKRVSPGDIRAKLRVQPQPTALVDLLEYFYFGKTGESSERRIAAFVVRGDREIVRVELGPAKPVADLVDRWRNSFGGTADSRQTGQELRQRLWEPLANHLDGCETVLISPDGQATRFPWSALPGDKPGTFLIEDRAIALIPTPQLLSEIPSEERPPRLAEGPLLLAGDVDFD
ncbi:MAG: tetratricopeptide repeat protein, partial [Planctomycetes bacterium]|nr:tetratricopeptide repeat protein [Planctomycetota bacterium]